MLRTFNVILLPWVALSLVIGLSAILPISSADAEALSVPRFVSLASDEVNMRTGPGKRYPVVWVYQKKGLPLEIINEFDVWRKVRDVQGDEGWIHKSMLSGRRTAIIQQSEYSLIDRPEKNEKTRILANLRPGVLVRAEDCREQFCRVGIEALEGWVEKSALWGVYPDETFDE